jgi:trehalose 6-phosphate synthase/phosphatase
MPIPAAARKLEVSYWRSYREVNELYAQEVLELSSSESDIWVHDYQLMLVPEILREKRPENHIGFFLHIPFPAPKDFAQLKNSKALVQGVLGSDLAGFHILSYVDNFLNAVEHYKLGTVHGTQITHKDRALRVTDFPIGIDYDKWRSASRLWSVRKEYARLIAKYRGKKVIMIADRLDMTKGYLERLAAYRDVLEQNPKLRGKTVLVVYAVPTRGDIEEYQALKEQVEAMVSDINLAYGTSHWQPVEYHYAALAFPQLRALYQRADVALVTPIRDGMNLTAKEYLASKPRGHGALVLSETAGAAQELHEAILVDPKDPASMVNGLKRALTTPSSRLLTEVTSMQKIVRTSTIHTWAGGFMQSLSRPISLDLTTRTLSASAQRQLAEDYRTALRRLILLDYDGTLAPFAAKPEDAKPTKELKKIVSKLATQPGSDVVIVSGRQRANLEKWLGGLGAHFAAEHGAYTKNRSAASWQRADSTAVSNWQHSIVPILELYAARTPGAEVEQKSTALVWHYRQASSYYAQKNLVILKRILQPLAKELGLQVRQGHKILEVKPSDIHKGSVAASWLESRPDFILAIGDDYTDEDMFTVLPGDAYTIKVGRGQTAARYRLKNPEEVLKLLAILS